MSLPDDIESVAIRGIKAASQNDKVAFVTTALKDYKTNSWVTPNVFQRELLSVRGKNTVLRIHRRGGKCVDASEPLTLASGRRVLAGELVGKDFSIPSIVLDKVSTSKAYAQDNGIEETLRLTTESGRSVVRSLEHPFYTPSGWKTIEELGVGELVAVPKRLACPQKSLRSDDELSMLAVNSIEKGVLDPQVFFLGKTDLGIFLDFFFTGSCKSILGRDILNSNLGFSSESHRLILDLQELLLRLPVLTKVSLVPGTRFWSIKKDTQRYSSKDAPESMHWETVTLKESTGMRRTVAVQVPGSHNFLTSFYEHNTYGMILVALYECLTRRRGQILFVAPRMSQVEMFFDELDKFIEANPWIKNCLKTSSKRPFKKTFTNGTVIKGFTLGASGKSGGTSLRGQTADVILLDEIAFMNANDFAAIQPIIEGDVYRPVETKAYAASTPAAAAGMFFSWCTDKTKGWHEIFMPVTENPDWSDEKKKAVQQRCSSREWQVEWLCNFMDAGASVFSRSTLINAQKNYIYCNPEKCPMPDRVVETPGGKPVKKVWRTMGVDWDKYNRDGAGPQIAVVELDKRDPKSEFYNKPRVIYRQSLPQGKFTLTDAVDRIIRLNYLMRPDLIYVDRGGAESNVELLHKRGLDEPSSRLHKIVKGIAFHQLIKCPDPTDQTTDKRFKPFMVNLLNYWLEQGELIVPARDKELFEQFSNYQIKSINLDGSAKFNQDHEHIIDATGLACVALWKLHKSPFERRVGTQIYMLPAPQRVAAEDLDPEELAHQPAIVQAVIGIGRQKSKAGIDFQDKSRTMVLPRIGQDDPHSAKNEIRQKFRQSSSGFNRTGRDGAMNSPMKTSFGGRSFRR